MRRDTGRAKGNQRAVARQRIKTQTHMTPVPWRCARREPDELNKSVSPYTRFSWQSHELYLKGRWGHRMDREKKKNAGNVEWLITSGTERQDQEPIQFQTCFQQNTSFILSWMLTNIWWSIIFNFWIITVYLWRSRWSPVLTDFNKILDHLFSAMSIPENFF